MSAAAQPAPATPPQTADSPVIAHGGRLTPPATVATSRPGAFATLDPRPIGWFAVARSAELPRGATLDGVLATVPFRLHRRDDGGLDVRGLVGAVVEQNGFVLAWHHPRNAPPTWRIPALDDAGWRPLQHHLLRARSHPQEIYENSIDVGHFPVIHGYHSLAVVRPMRLRDHEMDIRYRIARRLPGPLASRSLVSEFEVRLHGLGCAHNHIEVPALGLRVRMIALATPTTPGDVDIRLAVTIAADSGGRLGGLLRPLIHAGVKQGIVADFGQDLAIWAHKRYLPRPLLVKGDGPIEMFRRWSAQFYCPSAEAPR